VIAERGLSPGIPHFDADLRGFRSIGQRLAALLAAALLAVGAALLWQQSSRLSALWLTGAGFGFALHSAAFGFSAGFRRLLREHRSAHVRAQLLMLGIAVLLFFPALAAGSVLGQPVRGFVFPAGLAVVVGAFVFGVGMQLAGGCASGTLYSVGGGSTRMLVTLTFVVFGATLAAYGAEFWSDLPALAPASLLTTLGLLPALLLQFGVFGLGWIAINRLEKRRHGAVESIWRRPGASLVRGGWPYAWTALALAVLNFATLVLAGRPWGITQAFALWGSHAIDQLGFDDPVFWSFWEEPTRAEALHRALWADTTTVMNIGIIIGALLAAALAGTFTVTIRVPAAPLLASIIGGLLLGIGAIVSTGCNISAFFSGIASGSAHGWLWILAALPGNWLGARLRPLFRLDDASPFSPTALSSTPTRI
jgi:uncharacterized membrane protein YedE/YeeE